MSVEDSNSNIKVKTLLGPGPSNVHPRVYSAMTTPILSHLDPQLWSIMDETVELLRETFQTENKVTLPLSGTGMAGMETAIANAIQPGETIIIGVHGFFANRLVEVAERCEANVVKIQTEWGEAVSADRVEEELKLHNDAKVVALVHCETSTGVLQPLEEIARITRKHGALLLVDSVASLGGHDLPVDSLGIDICYTGSQKVLSCPPGMAPITFSPRALEVIKARKVPPRSWYLDIQLLEQYWVSDKKYHHTVSASLIYALRESLRILLEEGLSKSFARHKLNGKALRAGIESMGLQLVAAPEVRSDTLNGVLAPEGLDADKIRSILMDDYDIETGGGLGDLKGKLIRIGLMGQSSKEGNVLMILSALERILQSQGFEISQSAGVTAAHSVYAVS